MSRMPPRCSFTSMAALRLSRSFRDIFSRDRSTLSIDSKSAGEPYT